ncbi:hypothetical protein ACHAXT_002697 [Thalassiosira profunda]
MAEVQHLRSGRRLEATVTDYSQRWTVRTAPGGDRVVRAVMRVTMAITSGELYGFKSLVDRAHEKSVSGVRVTDAATSEVLRHELSEKNGYVFVKWWYTEPVRQNGVASTVIEYDLHDAVSGCSLADQPPEATGSSADICKERFEAPWANFWKIPVADIHYTFRVPYNETGHESAVTNSMVLEEPSPCCSAEQEYILKADGVWELSQRFTPAELGIGSRNPKMTAFRWQVSDPNGSIAHCRQVCSSEEVNPLIWLTLIVPGLAIVGGLVVYCKRRNRRKQLDGNESRRGAEAEAPAAMRRPLPKATAYDAEYDSSMPTAESAVAVANTKLSNGEDETAEGGGPPGRPDNNSIDQMMKSSIENSGSEKAPMAAPRETPHAARKKRGRVLRMDKAGAGRAPEQLHDDAGPLPPVAMLAEPREKSCVSKEIRSSEVRVHPADRGGRRENDRRVRGDVHREASTAVSAEDPDGAANAERGLRVKPVRVHTGYETDADATADDASDAAVRPSDLEANNNDQTLVIPEAFVVRDDSHDVVDAKLLTPWWKQRRTLLLACLCLTMTSVAIAVGITLSLQNRGGEDDASLNNNETSSTTSSTTAPPAATVGSIERPPDPYDQGRNEGMLAAEQKWDDDGNTCADVWNFDDDTDAELMRRIYSDKRDDNWEEALFKEGARAGVSEVVEKYQVECLGVTERQCEPLGWAAARQVARESCPSFLDRAAGPDEANYEEDCRRFAINVCKGGMSEALTAVCQGRAATTRKILELQEKCESRVNALLRRKSLRHS